nr:MAG TPA: hypothetical protein [Caudoviricetes sp.]
MVLNALHTPLYVYGVLYPVFVYFCLFGALLTSGGELDRLDISSPPRA